jgi:hypothetical protein
MSDPPAMRFELLHRDGAARRARLEFARGAVDTPAFMPVGTYGTVKAMTPEELESSGARIVLGNTFHLFLRPGLEVIETHAGLHRFMHWERPILTDSGGFQVFSLAASAKLTEEGVQFRSPVDGAPVFLSPEESMRIQGVLRSDIAMSFDECTRYPATPAEARASMERSMRWARRGFEAYHRDPPPGTLFGIVQGGVHASLRLESLDALERIGFAGLAVGGLAVGETAAEREAVLDALMPNMPTSSKRCGAASICSTASCPRGMPATATCSRAAVPSTSATPRITRTWVRSSRTANAIPVGITAAATCGISIDATRSWARASTRFTTCTSTSGSCRSCARQSRAGASRSTCASFTQSFERARAFRYNGGLRSATLSAHTSVTLWISS